MLPVWQDRAPGSGVPDSRWASAGDGRPSTPPGPAPPRLPTGSSSRPRRRSRSRLVSPADGTVTFTGPYLGGSLQQVKGVHYSLPKFLGRSSYTCKESLLQNKHTGLYQVVIYLHPGDYHRFHSPVTWHVHSRTRVWGELLSVAPPILRNIQGLFELNSRVVLEGEWRWGFFSLTAVGATNVGSIKIEWEPEESCQGQGGLRSQIY